jgi:phospholipid/cholesterol/gamma-HCH transport system permease protein
MVLALQTGIELHHAGQLDRIGAITGIIIFREVGPIMTAFVMASLIGSAIAGHIASMKLSEQIDALQVMSINPVSYLVMPRVMAVAFACPVLTVLACLIGVIGGSAVGAILYGVELGSYVQGAREWLTLKDVYSGLCKAFVFGVTIAIIASSQGLRAGRNPEGVSRAVLRTVVLSVVFILLLDLLLGWLFYAGSYRITGGS